MSKGILVIGSLNMDMSVVMKKMPVVGETVMGDGITYSSGGKGANQACAAGKLKGQVKMLGCIGRDEFGREQKAGLSSAGVDVSQLKESEAKTTGTAVIYVDRDGSNSIVVAAGANQECDIPYLESRSELFDWCDYVLMQMEIPMETICYAAQKAKAKGKIVILNPAPAPEAISDDLLQYVDYLTPNETELQKLSGVAGDTEASVREGAGRLLERGVGTVLVTLGEKGAMAVRKDGFSIYPPRKVCQVDTTAAGDCFNGAFAVGLAEGKTEENAILFANLASSLTVTRKGAQNSLPLRAEVEALVQQDL